MSGQRRGDRACKQLTFLDRAMQAVRVSALLLRRVAAAQKDLSMQHIYLA